MPADRDPTTAELCAEVLRLDAEATGSPWEHRYSQHPNFGEETAIRYAAPAGEDDVVVGTRWYDGPHLAIRSADAALIAHYRTAAPMLARRLVASEQARERAEAANEAMRAAVSESKDGSPATTPPGFSPPST